MDIQMACLEDITIFGTLDKTTTITFDFCCEDNSPTDTIDFGVKECKTVVTPCAASSGVWTTKIPNQFPIPPSPVLISQAVVLRGPSQTLPDLKCSTVTLDEETNVWTVAKITVNKSDFMGYQDCIENAILEGCCVDPYPDPPYDACSGKTYSSAKIQISKLNDDAMRTITGPLTKISPGLCCATSVGPPDPGPPYPPPDCIDSTSVLIYWVPAFENGGFNANFVHAEPTGIGDCVTLHFQETLAIIPYGNHYYLFKDTGIGTGDTTTITYKYIDYASDINMCKETGVIYESNPGACTTSLTCGRFVNTLKIPCGACEAYHLLGPGGGGTHLYTCVELLQYCPEDCHWTNTFQFPTYTPPYYEYAVVWDCRSDRPVYENPLTPGVPESYYRCNINLPFSNWVRVYRNIAIRLTSSETDVGCCATTLDPYGSEENVRYGDILIYVWIISYISTNWYCENNAGFFGYPGFAPSFTEYHSYRSWPINQVAYSLNFTIFENPDNPGFFRTTEDQIITLMDDPTCGSLTTPIYIEVHFT